MILITPLAIFSQYIYLTKDVYNHEKKGLDINNTPGYILTVYNLTKDVYNHEKKGLDINNTPGYILADA